MKKITLFIFTFFTVATLFAAARPSLDGRAVVAESGTMPRGLFARTVGYLPGDSVTVTNPATGSTIDVLILGAIDPSEGVAILLSPEAADGLRIKPDSNVQVKLTKRSGSLDENANGSAVLSEGEDDEIPAIAETEENASLPKTEPKAQMPLITESEPAAPSEESEKSEPEETDARAVIAEKAPDYEELPPARETTPVSKTPVTETKPVVAEKIVSETPVVAEVTPVPTVSEEPEDEENLETVYEILPPLPGEKAKNKQRVVVIEGEEPDYEEERAVAEIEEEPYEEERAVAKIEEEPYEEERAVAKIEEEPVNEKYAENYIEEKVQPVVAETETGNEEPVKEQPVILVEVEREEAVVEELPEGIESEPVVVAETEDEPYNEEPYREDSRLALTDEPAPKIAEKSEPAATEADAYQPIVLVPAEPNPPVAEESPAPVEEAAPVIAKAEESEPAPVPVEEEAPKQVVSNDWTNYVVPSVKNLRSGSYYVQVASLGNKDNIKNFVDTYSTKYPVVLVQTSSKNAYQVMVGPLNIDEYGAVGEKFKDYGFKDSFVRKIK